MTISKHLVKWDVNPPNLWAGAPGYSIFYQNNSVGNPAPLATFFAAIQAFWPANILITAANTGEVLDEATGKMTGVWTSGTQVATPGTGSTSFPPQAGAQVKWYTSGFYRGRRTIGRTYLVPLTIAQFAAGGLLNTTTCNAIQAAAANLITQFAGSMVVWTRPVYGEKPPDGGDPPLIRAGHITPVTTAVVPTKSVTLNKRRDP